MTNKNSFFGGGGVSQKPLKQRQKRLILIITISLILTSIMLIGGSLSYLYFNKQGVNTNIVKSGCLRVALSESKGLTLENEVPVIDKVGREKEPYIITITNTCNRDAYFKTTLNVLDSSNTDNISKTKLAVSGDRTINSLLISDLIKAKLSNTPSNIVDTYLIDRGYIGVGESKTYNIKLWIDYEATSYIDSLDTKVIVDSYVKGQEPIYLQSNLSRYWKDKTDNEFNYLALYTLATKELPSTYSYNNEIYNLTNTIDVSEQGNGEVLLGEYANSDKLIAVIGQEEGVIAKSCFRMFSGYTSVAAKFELIDLSNFDTSQVQSMDAMFFGCTSLKKLIINNIDTKNVTSFGEILSGSSSLETIDLTNFDTRNVQNMMWFFSRCNQLKEINLASFDTSKVVYMEGMFSNCTNLKTLDLTSFNTTKTENMNNMFNNCTSLETIDLTSFDTTSLTNTSAMFRDASSLKEIKVGCNFTLSSVTNNFNMYQNCPVTLTKICSTN